MSLQRTLEIVQGRAISFLVVFVSVMMAISILLVSLKSREASCQEAAHELVLPIFLKPDLDNATLLDVVLTTLAKHSVNARFKLKEHNDSIPADQSGTYVSLDTSDGILRSNSYQLLAQTSPNFPGSQMFRVRYLATTMCNAPLPRILDVNYNVDKDVVVSKRLAWVVADTRWFCHETILRTMSPGPTITRFSQVETMVPSLQGLGGPKSLHDVPIVASNAYEYRTIINTPILYRGTPSSVQLQVQRWEAADARTGFWKVVLRSSNPFDEEAMRSMWEGMAASLSRWVIRGSALGPEAIY